MKSKRDPQTLKQILDALETGCSLTDAARSVGRSLEWLRLWRRDDQAVAEAVERAQARFVTEAAARIRKAGKQDWRANAWTLERRRPREWGKRETVEHEFVLELPSQLGSPEEIERLMDVDWNDMDARAKRGELTAEERKWLGAGYEKPEDGEAPQEDGK